jgi:branched-chain amino acid transport system substrate-binding protein
VSWYFVTVDYALGHALERDATVALKAVGGTVKGSRPRAAARRSRRH